MLGGPLGPLQENKRGKGGTAPLKKAGKPQGVSREVYALLGSEGLPPEVRLVPWFYVWSMFGVSR